MYATHFRDIHPSNNCIADGICPHFHLNQLGSPHEELRNLRTIEEPYLSLLNGH